MTVNPSTGIFSKMDSIPGVKWIRAFNTSCYCEASKKYSFIGGSNPNGTDFKLYTINATNGSVISNPIFPEHLNCYALSYSNADQELYGVMVFPAQSNISVVRFNTISGTYTTLFHLSGLSAVLKLMVDESSRGFIIEGADSAGNRCVRTIDMFTGNTRSQIATSKRLALVHHRILRRYFALCVKDPILPSVRQTYNLCSVDPVTGLTTDMPSIPNLALLSAGNETLDERNGRYIFSGSEYGDSLNYLYTLDIDNGNIIHRVPIPQRNVEFLDNLIQFRFDNLQNKLFALLWEAKKALPPPLNIDSSCLLVERTRTYPTITNKELIIDKNITTCKVFLNLYNPMGQLVWNRLPVADGSNTYDLSLLPAGLYFYKLYSSDKDLLTGKIIKQ